MALYRRPASPTEGKTSTAKKVAAANVGKYEIGAIETKIAVSAPKVEKPSGTGTVKPIAPVAEEVTEVKEKKVAPRKKVEAKKPAETLAVKSVAVAAEVAAPIAKAEAKEAPAKKAPAKKTAAEKKEAVKKTVAAKKEAVKKTAAAKKEAVKKTAAVKKEAVKKTVAAKKEAVKKTVAAKKTSSLFQIEYQGQNITADAIEAKLAEEIKSRSLKAKNVEIYVNIEEKMVYCVVDGNEVNFSLF